MAASQPMSRSADVVHPQVKDRFRRVFFLLVSKYCPNIIWVFFEYLNIAQIVSGINRLQKNIPIYNSSTSETIINDNIDW